jgi:hypothetical protein
VVHGSVQCKPRAFPDQRSGKEKGRDVLKSGQQSFSEKMVTLAIARKGGV